MTRALALLLAAAALAGCEALPSAGPTTLEVMAEGSENFAPGGAPSFALVDVDEDKIKALESLAPLDFSEVFPEPGIGASFRIAEGDVVNILIWESISAGISGGLFQPDRGAAGASAVRLPPQVVGPTGRVTVPFAGPILVRGRTKEQVEQAVVAGLDDKAFEPQAVVVVEKLASNTVTVLGEAARGGAVQLAPGAERITDVIAATGGLRAPLVEVKLSLTRDGVVHSAPLVEVFDNPRQNIRLSPGDIITATIDLNSITAIGATGLNRRINFGSRDFFLSEALGDVGGVLDARGDPSGVFVLRYESSAFTETRLGKRIGSAKLTPVAYRFNLDVTENIFLTQRFKMRDKDIIYITNAPSVELQKLFDIFRLGAGTAAVTGQLNRNF